MLQHPGLQFWGPAIRGTGKFLCAVLSETEDIRPIGRAFVKLFELGVPRGSIFGVWYAGGIDFRRFRTPSLRIFGVILGLLAMILSLSLGLRLELCGLFTRT